MFDCTRCGACCASFRVSFYWAAEDLRFIPETSITRLSPFVACMKGTDRLSPRCVHLEGEVGAHVTCTIYPHRPSPCREVTVGDEKCMKARTLHGLFVTPT